MSYLIRQEIENKIDYWLERASSSVYSDGLKWYQECNDYCFDLSKEFDIPVKKIAGILSALSPLKEYSHNQKLVKEFLKCQTCGHLTGQVKKCQEIYNSTSYDKLIINILNGRKTSSFYHNIVYPTSSNKITVDFRIWKFFKPDSWEHITSNRYTIMEQTFLLKALEYKLIGLQVQSICWLQTKLEHGNGKNSSST